jgi:hypothetical protein
LPVCIHWRTGKPSSPRTDGQGLVVTYADQRLYSASNGMFILADASHELSGPRQVFLPDHIPSIG